MPRNSTIKLKGGTAANIAAANPTPAAREVVVEQDTRLMKIGDGVSSYTSLGYVRPYVTATDRLLGRSTAGAGVAEEISCTSAARSILAASNVFACRAWANFNGTGTIAIRGSGNVTSIGDGGTGLYTINFTTAMPDANYAACVTSYTTASDRFSSVADTYATGSVRVKAISNATNALVDMEFNNVAIFR